MKKEKKKKDCSTTELPQLIDITILIKDNKIGEVLQLIIDEMIEYNASRREIKLIEWVANRIKEDQIAKKILQAYKKNPSKVSEVVQQIENEPSLFDLMKEKRN